MRHGFGLVVCLGAWLAACTSPSEKKLPSASITPHLDVAATDAACGDDITLYGAATPDLSYTYDYDSAGRMFHATGVYATGGANDDVTYTYDNLDRMTGMVETRGWGDTRYEIAADYDTLGELVDYTWTASSPTYNDSWRYAYSAFNQWGEPTREVITQQGQAAIGYTLGFDPDGRIISATEDNGPTTSYGYDDTGLVLTIDTNAGAWHGEVAYDDQFRELSETWGGSDPSAIATEQTYNWDSGRLLGATYRQSANNDPAGLALVETDTLRYGCSSARKAGAGRFRPAHPIARR